MSFKCFLSINFEIIEPISHKQIHRIDFIKCSLVTTYRFYSTVSLQSLIGRSTPDRITSEANGTTKSKTYENQSIIKFEYLKIILTRVNQWEYNIFRINKHIRIKLCKWKNMRFEHLIRYLFIYNKTTKI